MPKGWVVKPLTGDHDRHGFDCGVPALNAYLAQYARQHELSSVSRTFVAIGEPEPSRILGYYTLAAGGIDRSALPAAEAKRFPNFPVPIGRLARLAVDLASRGRGMGEDLLMDAIRRFSRTAKEIGMAAILIDAKDEQARRFYERFEFESLPGHPRTLWLPMKSARNLFR